jgi:hypothetical protein
LSSLERFLFSWLKLFLAEFFHFSQRKRTKNLLIFEKTRILAEFPKKISQDPKNFWLNFRFSQNEKEALAEIRTVLTKGEKSTICAKPSYVQS